MKYELRQLKPVQLILNSVKVYINSFFAFLIISLITSIPVMIYQYKFSYITLNYILNPTESNLISYTTYLLGLISISVVVTAISTGLIVPIVSKSTSEKK